jgi:hypothetical protein
MKTRPILFSAPMVRALLDGTKTQTRRIVKFHRANGREYFVCSRTSGGVCVCGMGEHGPVWNPYAGAPTQPLPQDRINAACPYGAPGDTLWVKETWAAQDVKLRTVKPTEIPEHERINYAADYTADDMDGLGPWRPSLFMRRWMSRITLEIVSVRVERLKAISEEDAVAEGVTPTYSHAGYDITTDLINCFIVEGFVGGIPKAGDEWQGMKVEHVQPRPARQIRTARDEYRRLWNRINGSESWDANPWVWVVEFRRVTP